MNNGYSDSLFYSTQQCTSSFIPLSQVPSCGYYTDLLARDCIEEDIKIDLPQSLDNSGSSSFQLVPPQSEALAEVISVPSSNTSNPTINSQSQLVTKESFNFVPLVDNPTSGNNSSPEPSQATLVLSASLASTLTLPNSSYSSSDDFDQEESLDGEDLSENDQLIKCIAQSLGDSLWNYSSNCAKKSMSELFGVKIICHTC